MEVFQNLVKDYPTKNVSELTEMQRLCGNVNLNGSEFSRLRYCEKNFNNIAKAYMILFDLTIVNQWHGIFFIFKRDKVFKNWASKIFGRQPLKKLKGYGLL